MYDESLKAYLAPTGLVSEPRGDLIKLGLSAKVNDGRRRSYNLYR